MLAMGQACAAVVSMQPACASMRLACALLASLKVGGAWSLVLVPPDLVLSAWESWGRIHEGIGPAWVYCPCFFTKILKIKWYDNLDVKQFCSNALSLPTPLGYFLTKKHQQPQQKTIIIAATIISSV